MPFNMLYTAIFKKAFLLPICLTPFHGEKVEEEEGKKKKTFISYFFIKRKCRMEVLERKV